MAAEVEYWPTPDPTIQEGNREQRLDAGLVNQADPARRTGGEDEFRPAEH